VKNVKIQWPYNVNILNHFHRHRIYTERNKVDSQNRYPVYMQFITGFNEPLLFTLCYMDAIDIKMNNYTKSIDET